MSVAPAHLPAAILRLRRIVARGLVPAGLALTVATIAATAWTGASPEVVAGNFATALIVGLTALELALGPSRPRLRNLPRDLTMFALNGVVDALARAAVAYVALTMAGTGPLTALPLPIALPLGLVVADGIAYAVHRAFHEHPLLWRIHALHHLPDELYILMSVVNGPLQVFVIRLLPFAALAVAGLHPMVIFSYAMLDTWTGLASHSGVVTDNPWLSKVWITPQVHRLHHSARPEHAGNHGLLITFWDRVFGTFVAPRSGADREEVPVGLAEADAPRSWIHALLLRR